MSTVVGSAAGNDDLFMFVEKVGKSKKKSCVKKFHEENNEIRDKTNFAPELTAFFQKILKFDFTNWMVIV